MKKIIIILFLILTFFNINTVYAIETDEVLKDQEETLGIGSFIKEAEKYTKGSFEDLNINDLYKNSISGKIDSNGLVKGIFKILGTEVAKTIRSLGYILIIIIIHSIIKSISEGMGNHEIGEITYYVQYVLIVTLIMTNFSETIVLIKNTINNLVGFINCLLPILLALMITTRKHCYSIYCPANTSAYNNLYRKLHNQCTITTYISSEQHFGIVSKISDKIQIDKISKFFKSSVVWTLGLVLTVFVRRTFSRRNTNKLSRPDSQ